MIKEKARFRLQVFINMWGCPLQFFRLLYQVEERYGPR